MSSRSFRNEKPKKRHLVQKEKGGVAGEVGDLRADIDDSFDRIEQEVDELITVLDNNNILISGQVKLNFQGVGVAIGIDSQDPRKVNITINPGASGAPDIQVPSLDTADVVQGRAVFVSANNKVLHSDARYYDKSIALGLYTGNSGRVLTQGVAAGAKFSNASPIPTAGARVFLARGDDEALDGAVGKLTVTPPAGPGSFIAEVGVVTYVNAVTFMASRTASVFVRVQKMLRRGQ